MLNKSFVSVDELEFLVANLGETRHEFVDRYLRGLSIVKRKNGSLSWYFKYQSPENLKEQKFKIGNFPTLSLNAARQMAFQVIKKNYYFDPIELGISNLSNNLYEEPLSITQNQSLLSVDVFFNEHYLPYIKTAKRSWKIDVSIFINHVYPILGKYPISFIKPYLVQEMMNHLKSKKLSASSINRVLIILRYMFNLAIKWKVLPDLSNPCAGIKELSLNNKKERYISSSEFVKLKVELCKSKNIFLPLLIQLLLLTGARRGEALNAKLNDIDLERGDWVIPLPKGGKLRHIPLNESAVSTILQIKNLSQSMNQLTAESVYLFPNPLTGKPFRQLFYSWDKARKAAGMADFRMHDLRHSFASALVNSGMTLYDVKEILGHTNIKTTERYAHLNNERLKKASSSVNCYYGPDVFEFNA